MIEVYNNQLVFSFPDVIPGAELRVSFERTLRIPDDGREYPLPPGFGHFPLRHVEDYRKRLPTPHVGRGGVMLPMHQREALWISFESRGLDSRTLCYPFAVQVAAGKIDAISGETWSADLHRSPQNYLVAPDQRWLDGFNIGKGSIRQFVAMPLGSGHSVEEQLTGKAEYGGLQIAVRPLRPEAFARYCESKRREPEILFQMISPAAEPQSHLGLGAGGRMHQEVLRDRFLLEDWHHHISSRCFVHLLDARVWPEVTGERAPKTPIDAAAYSKAGLPWFEFESQQPAIPGSSILAKVKSIDAIDEELGHPPVGPTIAVLRGRRIRIPESNW